LNSIVQTLEQNKGENISYKEGLHHRSSIYGSPKHSPSAALSKYLKALGAHSRRFSAPIPNPLTLEAQAPASQGLHRPIGSLKPRVTTLLPSSKI